MTSVITNELGMPTLGAETIGTAMNWLEIGMGIA